MHQQKFTEVLFMVNKGFFVDYLPDNSYIFPNSLLHFQIRDAELSKSNDCPAEDD